MEMYQDGVEVMILSDGAFCEADKEKRNPLEIDVCPFGYEFCTGDCFYYKEDLGDDMELTREQAIAEHRKMWNWIADNIESTEQVNDIFELKFIYVMDISEISVLPNHLCYMCETTGKDCRKCLDWPSNTNDMSCVYFDSKDNYKGLYSLCKDAKTWKEQAALARQIANLPERTDV